MKLAEWLKREKLTQQEFAERIHSSQSQVAKFAAGARIPSKETMRRIGEVTGGDVAPNDFYEFAEHGAPTDSEAAE